MCNNVEELGGGYATCSTLVAEYEVSKIVKLIKPDSKKVVAKDSEGSTKGCCYNP